MERLYSGGVDSANAENDIRIRGVYKWKMNTFDTDEIMVIDFDKNGWHGYFGEREEED